MSVTADARARRTVRHGPVRVLIVDDSALVRRSLSDALSRHDDIEVVGTAADPYIARERIVELRPDVITLDIEMPRMDGLSFLARMMRHFPLPAVIVSSLTPRNSEAALHALALGAVDVIAKPGSSMATAAVGEALSRAVRIASVARVARCTDAETSAATLARDRAVDASPALVALGASTGGAAALEAVLRRFPADAPGTVIAQHMPAGFTAAFARRLDGLCAMRVKEAEGGEEAVCALLTGMGSDGANGMLAMREAGAHTVAQHEETCVVYGMPREAVALGAAAEVLPLDRIADALMSGRRVA